MAICFDHTYEIDLPLKSLSTDLLSVPHPHKMKSAHAPGALDNPIFVPSTSVEGVEVENMVERLKLMAEMDEGPIAIRQRLTTKVRGHLSSTYVEGLSVSISNEKEGDRMIFRFAFAMADPLAA